MININPRYFAFVVLFHFASSLAGSMPIAVYSPVHLDHLNCKARRMTESASPRIVNLCDCLPDRFPLTDPAEASGSLDIQFDVGEENNLIAARVVKSSGYRIMDNSTLRSQMKCKFQSAFKDGKPVRGSFTKRYIWEIDGYRLSTLDVK